MSDTRSPGDGGDTLKEEPEPAHEGDREEAATNAEGVGRRHRVEESIRRGLRASDDTSALAPALPRLAVRARVIEPEPTVEMDDLRKLALGA